MLINQLKMFKKIIENFGLLLVLLLLFASCENKDSNDCINQACTEEFRTITVTIKDSENNPVVLDSFKVTNLENGNDLSRELNNAEFEAMRENGVYPLFGDEYAQDFRNKEVEINFKGYIDNHELINSNYIVGADCCHIILISGDPEISI
jgi:hypothetical protein